MRGIFGDLFDFNHDGKIDGDEEVFEYMLMDELMEEEENERRKKFDFGDEEEDDAMD